MKKTILCVTTIITLVLCACGKNAETENYQNSISVSEDIQTAYNPVVTTEQNEQKENSNQEQEVVINIQDFYSTNIGDPGNLYHIDESNTLWGCGNNEYGQLGQGTQDFDFHKDMVKIAENVIHVDYSQRFVIFLTADYKLYGMGCASGGAMQEYEDISQKMYINPTKYTVNSPKLLMENVVYARCGRDDIVCLLDDGSVWTWGMVWREETKQYLVAKPEKILEKAALITGGWYNHAALLQDGSVWTWGYNYAGNCGYEGEYVVSTPVKVAEDSVMVWTGRTEYNVGCNEISEFNGEYERGLENTIILKQDGTYWACGIGIGEEEKILSRYWEINDYSAVCSSEFMQIVSEKDF